MFVSSSGFELIQLCAVYVTAASPTGPSVSAVRRQWRGRAAEGTGGVSDQQPRAAADRATVRERPEPAGARGERRPAVLFGLHTEHTGGASHNHHAAGGENQPVTPDPTVTAPACLCQTQLRLKHESAL